MAETQNEEAGISSNKMEILNIAEVIEPTINENIIKNDSEIDENTIINEENLESIIDKEKIEEIRDKNLEDDLKYHRSNEFIINIGWEDLGAETANRQAFNTIMRLLKKQ